MASQAYAISGRRPRANNYVDILNAKLASGVLGRKRSIKDTKDYRAKVLSLDAKRIESNRKIAEENLEQTKKSATTSSLIGLGQMAVAAKSARTKNKAIRDIIEGGAGRDGSTGTSLSGGAESAGMGEPGAYDTVKGAGFFSKEGITDLGGWKTGAGNWGDILSGSLAGGPVGAQLAEKVGVAPWAGGAAASGALSYLSSGDPYTAAISAVLGGALGSLF